MKPEATLEDALHLFLFLVVFLSAAVAHAESWSEDLIVACNKFTHQTTSKQILNESDYWTGLGFDGWGNYRINGTSGRAGQTGVYSIKGDRIVFDGALEAYFALFKFTSSETLGNKTELRFKISLGSNAGDVHIGTCVSTGKSGSDGKTAALTGC